jgi:type IV pilus assembly protein PilX
MIAPSRTGRMSRQRGERGVALVVALILLVVATLIGLAASRGAILQERMSSNSYDRSLAFQRSEAALRAAEAAITANWKIAVLGGEDCSLVACALVPTNAFTSTNAMWLDTAATYDVNDARTPTGFPQYYIQFMGTGTADNSGGASGNADLTNYGSATPPDNVAYYRVTARSNDPANVGGRSIVVLQSTVRRAY